MNTKQYLGDGVYVDAGEMVYGSVVLTTNNGIADTNTIVLEDHVLQNLKIYINNLNNKFDSTRG